MSEQYASGTTPLPTDTLRVIEEKILIALNEGGTGGGPGGGWLKGVVDPEGVVTATAPAGYVNTANQTFWIKESGTGNTGWQLFVGNP